MVYIPLCNILHNVHSDNTITNYNSMLECDLGYRNISCGIKYFNRIICFKVRNNFK